MNTDTPDFQISFITQATDTVTRTHSFRDALSGIRTGRWAKQVNPVQVAYASGGKKAADAPKKHLPGFLFSGTFTQRSSAALIRHSGLICADLDELGQRLGGVKEQLSGDPHVLAAFISPTGTGLKVVFRCDSARPHKESYEALEHYVSEHFGLLIDVKCSDVSRICFVSHDPELFEADDAQVLPYPPQAPAKTYTPPKPTGQSDLTPIEDFNLRGGATIPDLLKKHGWTHLRGKYWCRPGKESAVSASWDHFPQTLVVFSDSPETRLPSDQKGFDPYGLYAHLEHGGDFTAATRALGQQGYGKQRVKQAFQEYEEDSSAEAGKAPTEIDAALAALLARRVSVANPPPEPVTRLYLADKPVATPGNLQTMTAKSKSGKTAATGATVAAVICAATGTPVLHDTFKFRASNPKGHAVIVMDTEQSPYDAWTCYHRNLQRAGADQDPPWLLHFALVGYNVKQRKEALAMALAYAKATFGGVFLVVIDGVAHFVSSVNELEECNTLADWLRSLSVTYDTAMLCVIHSNEGVKNGDDSRGHLGKQLMRDAESNLLLKKEGEITTITSEKQRKAPITAADGVAFKWSDEHQMHLSCETDTPKRKAGGRTKLHTIHEFMEVIPLKGSAAKSGAVLHRAANDLKEIKLQTFKDLLSDATRDGLLLRFYDEKSGFTYTRNI